MSRHLPLSTPVPVISTLRVAIPFALPFSMLSLGKCLRLMVASLGLAALASAQTPTPPVKDGVGFLADTLRSSLAHVEFSTASGAVPSLDGLAGGGAASDLAVDRANRRLYALTRTGLHVFQLDADGGFSGVAFLRSITSVSGTHLALSLDARTAYIASAGQVTAINLYPESVFRFGSSVLVPAYDDANQELANKRVYSLSPADRAVVAMGVHPAGDRLLVVLAASGNKVNVNNDLLRSDVGNGVRADALAEDDLPADFGYLSQLDISDEVQTSGSPRPLSVFTDPVSIKELIYTAPKLAAASPAPAVALGIKSLAFSPDGNTAFLAAVGGQTVRATAFGIMPTTDEGTGGIVVLDVRPRPEPAPVPADQPAPSPEPWVAYIGFIPTTERGEETAELRADIRKEGWKIVHPQVQWARNLALQGEGEFGVASGSPFTALTGLTSYTLGMVVLAEMEASFKDYGYMQAYNELYPRDMVGASAVAISHSGRFGVVTMQDTNNLGLLTLAPSPALEGYTATARPEFFIQTGTVKTINAFEGPSGSISTIFNYQWAYPQEVAFTSDDSRIFIGMSGGTPKADLSNRFGSADAAVLLAARDAPDAISPFRSDNASPSNPSAGYLLHAGASFQSPRQVATRHAVDTDADRLSNQLEAYNRWNSLQNIPAAVKPAMVSTSVARLTDPSAPLPASTKPDDAMDQAFFLPSSGVGYRFDAQNQPRFTLNAGSLGAVAAIERLGRLWHEAYLAGEITRPYFIVGVIAQPGGGILKNAAGEELQYGTRNGFQVSFPYLGFEPNGDFSDAPHDFVLSNGAATPRDNTVENLSGFDALHTAKLLQLLHQASHDGKLSASRIALDPAVRDELLRDDQPATVKALVATLDFSDSRVVFHGVRPPTVADEEARKNNRSRRDLDAQASVSFSPLAVNVAPTTPPTPPVGTPPTPPVPGRHYFEITLPDHLNRDTLRVVLPPFANPDDYLVRTADGTLLVAGREYTVAELLGPDGKLILSVDPVAAGDWELALEVLSPELDTVYSLADRFEYIRWTKGNDCLRHLATCDASRDGVSDANRTTVEAETVGFYQPVKYRIASWVRDLSFAPTGPSSPPTIDEDSGLITSGKDAGTLLVVAEATPPGGSTERTSYQRIIVGGCGACASGQCEETGKIEALPPEKGMELEIHDGNGGKLTFLRETPGPGLLQAINLEYPYHTAETRILRDASGALRQILTEHVLIDIQAIGSGGFAVATHLRPGTPAYDAEAGLYALAGSAVSSLRVEPDPTAGENGVLLTQTRAGLTERHAYLYSAADNSWTLFEHRDPATGTYARRQTVGRTSSGGLSFTTRTMAGPDGEVFSKQVDALANTPSGPRLASRTNDPDGANHVTHYDYNDEGLLASIRYHGGAWARYFYDGQERVTKRIAPWLNAPFTALESASVVTTYDYTPLVSSTGPTPRPDAPRTTIVTTLGVETSRSYDHYEPHLHRSITALLPGAAWNAADNLVTTTRFVASGFFAGRAASVLSPDGTMALYAYERLPGGGERTVVSSGVPDPARTSIIDGTVSITVTNRQENEISSVTRDIATGLVLDEREALDTDAEGRVLLWSHFDGTTTSATYGCCGVQSETDRLGITTTHTYDRFKRLETSTRLGITTRYERDASGRVLRTYRRGTDGVETLVARTDFLDVTGEAVDSFDALGRKTESRTVYNPDGTTTRTTTLPGGFTQWQKSALDGRPLETGGTAAAPGRYEYRVETLAGQPYLVTRQIALGEGGAATEWTESWTDMAGRPFRAYSANGAYAENSYDPIGRLARVTDPDGVTTLFAYNERGERAITALDRNRNGVIDYFGEDRITRIKSEYATKTWEGASFTVSRSTSELWADDSSGLTLTATLSGGSVSSITVTGTGAPFSTLPAVTFSPAPSGGVIATGIAVLTDGILTGVTITNPGSGYIAAPTVSLSVEPLLLSTSEQSVDGLRAWSTSFGRVSVQETIRPSTPDGSWLTRSTAADGTYTVARYTAGRLRTTTAYDRDDVRLGQVTYGYDTVGRTETVTDARLGETSYAYYADDQIKTVTSPHPEGTGTLVTTTFYNDRGLPERRRLPDNTETSYTYTAQGQLDRVSGSQTYPIDYDYDPQGRMLRMTTWQDYAAQSGAAITTWNYHPQTGRLVSKVYPQVSGLTSQVSYTYTDAGRLLTRTWARGLVSTYAYHPDGALATVDYDDDAAPDPTPDVAYTYHRHGQVKEIRDGLLVDGAITDANLRFRHAYAFDAELRPDTETIATLAEHTLTRLYEEAAPGKVPGRYRGFTVSGSSPQVSGLSSQVSYSYDSAGRLHDVTSPAGVFTYAYVPDSGMVESITGPVHTVTHTHQPKGNGLRAKANTVGQTLVSRFGYTVNELGQRTVATNTGTAFAQPAQFVYRYNEKGEVIAGDRFEGDNPTQPGAPILPETYAFTFDDIGNRKKSTRGAAATPFEQRDYTANLLNQYSDISGFSPQVSSFSSQPSYDLDGNLKSDGRWTYAWDGENRLIRMEMASELAQTSGQPSTRLEFTYDHQGRRVRKQTFSAPAGTTAWSPVTDLAFVYDGWNLIATSEKGLTSGLWSLASVFSWGADLSGSLQGAGGVGGLLAVTTHTSPSSHTSYFPTYDGNGNISEYLGETGELVAHYEYSPFGETIRASGAMAEAFTFRFSTKYEDAESGYYYYGFRYYNPSTGRWLSRDPIEEQGGIGLYSVVGNNTIHLVDKLGLSAVATTTAVSSAVTEAELAMAEEALRRFGPQIASRTAPAIGTAATAIGVSAALVVVPMDDIIKGPRRIDPSTQVTISTRVEYRNDGEYLIEEAEYGDSRGLLYPISATLKRKYVELEPTSILRVDPNGKVLNSEEAIEEAKKKCKCLYFWFPGLLPIGDNEYTLRHKSLQRALNEGREEELWVVSPAGIANYDAGTPRFSPRNVTEVKTGGAWLYNLLGSPGAGPVISRRSKFQAQVAVAAACDLKYSIAIDNAAGLGAYRTLFPEFSIYMYQPPGFGGK